jgi:uncharacterized membrane protein YebE (DUF533 family)
MTVEEYVKKSDTKLITSSVKIDKQNYEEKDYLDTLALYLNVNLNEQNTARTEIDKASFEATIEMDFIDTDY